MKENLKEDLIEEREKIVEKENLTTIDKERIYQINKILAEEFGED